MSRELLARAWSAGAGPGDGPLTIDLDSTICETYGLAKEGARDHGYTGQRGYHPLLAIAAGTGDVLMARLRKGRANTVRGAAHFLRETVGRVRYGGARGQLTVRADSGFYAHAIVAVCRKMDVRFSITIRQHKSLRNIIEAIPKTDWTPISTGYIRLTLQRLIINLIEGGGRYSFPTPQPDDRPAHVVHFTAAVYTWTRQRHKGPAAINLTTSARRSTSGCWAENAMTPGRKSAKFVQAPETSLRTDPDGPGRAKRFMADMESVSTSPSPVLGPL